jgi:DNA-binding winged helix-turn-helix (wHTH) protein
LLRFAEVVPPAERYRFGAFTLDVGDRRLSRGADVIALPPKAHDVLVALVRRAGHLATRQELLDAVWPGVFVEDGILSVHVAALRKALGDASTIATVPRAGYRFNAAVEPLMVRPPGRLGLVDPVPARPPALYELCGQGRRHLLSASTLDAAKAVAAFEAAIALDSTYAAAHAGLARAWCAQAELRAAPHADAYARAKAAALRALAMGDGAADAQLALGTVLYVSEWDWEGARRSLERAMENGSGDRDVLLIYGRLLETLGDLDGGLAAKQRALERDPASPLVLIQVAMSYWYQRRYDDSIAWADRALAIDPRHLLAREHLVGAYWKKGDFDRVIAENIRQAEAYGLATGALDRLRAVCAELSDAYASGGRAAFVACARAQAAGSTQPAGAIQRAVLAGEAGDLDEAFRELDCAIANRDPCLVTLAIAPQWDPLRGDRRFDDRLARMGLR